MIFQPLQYPSTEPGGGENEGNTYVNMSRFQEQRDVYNMPLPPMQGQPMQAPPGQPVLFPPQFFMGGLPPNMYPPQGATGQDAPTEAGNFPDPQQVWMQQMQQMQFLQQMQYLQQFGAMPGMTGAPAAPPVAPPPYSSFEEETPTKQSLAEGT